MSRTIIYLDFASPQSSSSYLKTWRAAIWSLSALLRTGFTRSRSVARPVVVSYTSIPPLPVNWRFIFCCTFLRVTSTGRYPASCPMKPGLSSAGYRSDRLYHSWILYNAYCTIFYAVNVHDLTNDMLILTPAAMIRASSISHA